MSIERNRQARPPFSSRASRLARLACRPSNRYCPAALISSGHTSLACLGHGHIESASEQSMTQIKCGGFMLPSAWYNFGSPDLHQHVVSRKRVGSLEQLFVDLRDDAWPLRLARDPAFVGALCRRRQVTPPNCHDALVNIERAGHRFLAKPGGRQRASTGPRLQLCVFSQSLRASM